MDRHIPAELVLKSGRIETMDSRLGTVEAVAVCRGRITAAGSNREIAAQAGDGSEMIDLGGATVLPGLIDTHAHFCRIGPLLSSHALLYDMTSIEDVVAELENG